MARYSEAKFIGYVNRDNLRETRKKKNVRVTEILKALGLSSSVSYYNIENGLTEPKISQMVIISQMLDEPVTNFFNL